MNIYFARFFVEKFLLFTFYICISLVENAVGKSLNRFILFSQLKPFFRQKTKFFIQFDAAKSAV